MTIKISRYYNGWSTWTVVIWNNYRISINLSQDISCDIFLWVKYFEMMQKSRNTRMILWSHCFHLFLSNRFSCGVIHIWTKKKGYSAIAELTEIDLSSTRKMDFSLASESIYVRNELARLNTQVHLPVVHNSWLSKMRVVTC